eukprot:6515935-Alexandrium_andersonii.AAC.1
MSASLVGSEMCIRDSAYAACHVVLARLHVGALGARLMARLHVGALVVIARTHVGALHAVDAQGCAPHTQAAQWCVPRAEAAFAGDARCTCTPALAPLSRAKKRAC